jgi:hypothetical protein
VYNRRTVAELQIYRTLAVAKEMMRKNAYPLQIGNSIQCCLLVRNRPGFQIIDNISYETEGRTSSRVHIVLLSVAI